eukprot:4453029-Alexandrium_andersonii.AAC.1
MAPPLASPTIRWDHRPATSRSITSIAMTERFLAGPGFVTHGDPSPAHLGQSRVGFGLANWREVVDCRLSCSTWRG